MIHPCEQGTRPRTAEQTAVEHSRQLDSRISTDAPRLHASAALACGGNLRLVEFTVSAAISVLFGNPIHGLG